MKMGSEESFQNQEQDIGSLLLWCDYSVNNNVQCICMFCILLDLLHPTMVWTLNYCLQHPAIEVSLGSIGKMEIRNYWFYLKESLWHFAALLIWASEAFHFTLSMSSELVGNVPLHLPFCNRQNVWNCFLEILSDNFTPIFVKTLIHIILLPCQIWQFLPMHMPGFISSKHPTSHSHYAYHRVEVKHRSVPEGPKFPKKYKLPRLFGLHICSFHVLSIRYVCKFIPTQHWLKHIVFS